MPWMRRPSSGSCGMSSPTTTVPVEFAGIFSIELRWPSRAPTAKLSLPTNVWTPLPGTGAESTATTGMPAFSACENGGP